MYIYHPSGESKLDFRQSNHQVNNPHTTAVKAKQMHCRALHNHHNNKTSHLLNDVVVASSS